jgi:ABC-type polar amino acid transport system ATPase subunit
VRTRSALAALERTTRAESRAIAPLDRRPPAVDVAAVAFENVSLAFDDNVVLRDISFAVARGRLRVLLGPSGAGKTVILKPILGFLKPDSGVIRINGERTDTMTEEQLMEVRPDIGVLFQEGALFDSLTVAENVGYRLYEETDMPVDDVRRRSKKFWAARRTFQQIRFESKCVNQSWPCSPQIAWRSAPLARWTR